MALTKFVYFILLIIVTVTTLVWWTDAMYGPAAILTLDTLFLWALPALSRRRSYLVPIVVWLNVIALSVLLCVSLMFAAA